VRVSVVTPSFRGGDWLRLCIASVADQGVAVEHIIQDAGSDDGTLDWLLAEARVKAFVEKDAGMYDAINRGLRRATGDICAYLNCDEQYLPGALAAVQACFEQNPQVDVVFGDIVIVDAQGDYLFHRKVLAPLRYHTWVSHLATLSCAMFFRRRLVAERGFFFDERLRDVGDGKWVLRLLGENIRMRALRQFTSVFTCTGRNMCVGDNARREASELRQSAPAWARAAKPLIVWHHRLRRLWGGAYCQGPFTYSLYTRESPSHRVTRHVTRPTSRWTLGS
jgi:glycosyltransferase involved in cell wall biosynthesis